MLRLSSLVSASLIILESDADPSHPGKTYVNFKSKEQDASTFCVGKFFLPRYLLTLSDDALTRK